MSHPVRIFVSYAHEDDAYRERLALILHRLEREYELECWSDRAIMPGQDWSAEIDSRLQDADLVILLVSDAFLASDYIQGVEMRLALEGHRKGSAQVIPVIIRACDWTTAPFAAFQALPRDAKPVASWPVQDEAWADVAKRLRVAIEAVATPLQRTAPSGEAARPPQAPFSGAGPEEILHFIDSLIGSQRTTVGIGTAVMVLMAVLGLCATVLAVAGVALLVPAETRAVQIFGGLFVASSPLFLMSHQTERRDRVAGLRLLRAEVVREQQRDGQISIATLGRFQQLWTRSLGATERIGS